MQTPIPRYAFLIHPLVPWHRRILAARRLHVPGMLAQGAGVDLVGPGALVRMQTAAGDVEALIVGVPDLAAEIIGDQSRALALMLRATRSAEAHGAQVIGLANALGVVAGRGSELQRHTSLPVTSGQASTAWACTEITRAQLARRGTPRGPVAVFGFTGTVGDAVATLLASEGVDVRVEAAGAALAKRAESVGVRALEREELLATCDVLVGANTTGPVLSPKALRPDTWLVDLALPPTLEPGPLPKGFLRVPGEVVHVPGRMRAGFWGRLWLLFAGYGRGRVFACFAEPAVMALTGERDFSRGRRLDVARVRAVGLALRHLGFRAV
jgi:predicted amino acid dehydrogenase